ncbi:putative metal-dependent hydrolase [Pedobacter sp. MC2016-14]|uniref:YfiT family bacillithiol transferase n=1 Tax=Pedobacter sp. MC2016-14 TaxID=2897327 RepID=UPI001E2FE157|nr:putative metal-dependent hydrolase [Pedobacter sp. MC2016-14]MCD0488204.1 putative metal-dependent hydrolase [Pedobacter sp. MC2016-14]
MEESIETLKYPIGRFIAAETYAPHTLNAWIHNIRILPVLLDGCIENLDEVQLNTPYRPGGWTIIQVIHHIADSHMNAYIRLKLALTADQPTIVPYNEQLWAELPDVFDVPVNMSVTLVHALHVRWTTMLRLMKDEDWLRNYYHPEDDKLVALWQMTNMYSWHGKHHVEQIMALRKRMAW